MNAKKLRTISAEDLRNHLLADGTCDIVRNTNGPDGSLVIMPHGPDEVWMISPAEFERFARQVMDEAAHGVGAPPARQGRAA